MRHSVSARPMGSQWKLAPSSRAKWNIEVWMSVTTSRRSYSVAALKVSYWVGLAVCQPLGGDVHDAGGRRLPRRSGARRRGRGVPGSRPGCSCRPAARRLAEQVKRFAVSRFPSVCLEDIGFWRPAGNLAQQRGLPHPGSPRTLSTMACPLRAASSAAEMALICSSCQSTFGSPSLTEDLDQQDPGVGCGNGDREYEGEREPVQAAATAGQEGGSAHGIGGD
jgi:hypothetical protein